MTDFREEANPSNLEVSEVDRAPHKDEFQRKRREERRGEDLTDVEDMPEHANTNEELNRESENEEDLVATRNPEELHLSMSEHFFQRI